MFNDWSAVGQAGRRALPSEPHLTSLQMVSYIENPGRYSTYALSCIVMAQEGSPKSTMIGQKAITSAADVELADSCVEVGTAEQSTMSDEWQ